MTAHPARPQTVQGTSPRAAPWPADALARRDHYWPAELLEAFTLRMSAHGMSVISSMMMGDRRYALQELARAHTTNDDGLRLLAVELFRYFEQHQSGLTRMN